MIKIEKIVCKLCNEEFYDYKSNKRVFCSPTCRNRFWNKFKGESVRIARLGTHHSLETKIKIGNALRGRFVGENSSRYIDGRTKICYPQEFFIIKPFIKERDDYTCQNCGMTEEEHIIVLGTSLEVHHIDYNKLNNDDSNLITTCKQCNVRANSNREQWTDFYQKKIQMIYA